MSWISDIKEEFRQLDISNKKLKQFAYLVGFFVLSISLWYYLKHGNRDWTYISGIISIILIFTGIIYTKILTGLYKFWMGIAFVLGWFVSRILISIVFYLALTPISLLGRLIRKKWMDVDYNKKSNSYWIAKDEQESGNYDKMY